MKKKTRLMLIFAVLAVLATAYFVISSQIAKDTDKDDSLLIYATDSAKIESFSYRHMKDSDYDDKTYTFKKSDGKWIYADDAGLPVNQSIIAAKTVVLSSIKAERLVEDDVKDISVYGLDEPFLTVDISSGTTTTLLMGDYNNSTQTYYVMKKGDSKVYLTDANLYIAFDMQLSDVMEKEEYPDIDPDSFISICLQYRDLQIILKKEESGSSSIEDSWYLLDEAGQNDENSNLMSTSHIPKLISGLEYLRKLDYSYNDNKAQDYGFDNPNLKVTAEYEDKGKIKEFILIIGKETSESNIYEDCYVMTNFSSSVMSVEYEKLEELLNISRASLILY